MTCERMHQAPINCIPNTNPMICTMPKKKHQSATQFLKLKQNTWSGTKIGETNKYNEKTNYSSISLIYKVNYDLIDDLVCSISQTWA